MVIPFASIQTFVDPSVEFGLRFEAHDSDEMDVPTEIDSFEPDDDDDPEPQPERNAEVVSLDKFRKH